MALAEYGNAFNIDTDGSGNPILVDPQSGDTIAIYDRGTSSWQVTTIEATTGDFDSLNAEIGNNAQLIKPGDDLQAKIDSAGVGGEVVIHAGQHDISSPISTHENQSWRVAGGARFVPQKDINAFDFTGVVNLSVTGGLFVDDANDVTSSSSSYAFVFDDTQRCHFDAIRSQDYYKGLVTKSDNGHVSKNAFGKITVNGSINRGMELGGETHDNNFGVVDISSTNTASSDRGIQWSTTGQDGGNVFESLRVLSMGSHGIVLDSGEFEIEFGNVFLDSCGGDGLLVTSGGSKLYFDTLFVGANARGAVFDGGSGSPITYIDADTIHARANINSGIVAHYVENFDIGTLFAENNGSYGVNFNQAGVENGTVGSLHTDANANGGVNSPGVGSGVHIEQEFVSDGMNRSDFDSVNGDAMPEDLTARSGDYEGEHAYHNGTDGNNTNRNEFAVWDGVNWNGLISGNVID